MTYIPPAVRIVCDASYNPQTRAAAWGCVVQGTSEERDYIGLDGALFARGGSFLERATDATHAEILGLTYGIFFARACFDRIPDHVVIECDCATAIAGIEYVRPAAKELKMGQSRRRLIDPNRYWRTFKKPDVRMALDTIKLQLEEFPHLYVRHLTGHAQGKNMLHFANTLADQLAVDARKRHEIRMEAQP